jgi:predicted transcriptional regulator
MLRSKSLPISHTFKYRDRVSIISDILAAVKNSKKGRRKTQIMQSANLNYAQTKKYLHYLLDCGYLMVTKKETYTITHEGSRFLHLVDLQKINIAT